MLRDLRLRALWLPVLSLALCCASAQSDARQNALALEQQGQTAEAAQAWQGIASADPRNAEAFAHLGLLSARQENYAAAVENYKKAISLAPAMPGLTINLGLAYFKANQYPDAIKVFSSELNRQSPGSPAEARLIILLGMAHYGMGDYLVAIPYLRRAADADPRSLPLRLTLAHSCMWSKQYECVLRVYKEILLLDPGSAEADMLAGEALDEKGDDAGAIEQFRAATRANPKEPNAHFGLGYLLWKQHHFDEAVQEFQAELETDPASSQSRAYLGDSLVELNRYGQAGPELERASAQATPTSAMSMVHRDLGVVYSETGRKEDAARELLMAISLDPKDVAPHWRLGKLYQSMGRKQEAKAEFEIASAMNEEKNRPVAQAMDGERPKTQP